MGIDEVIGRLAPDGQMAPGQPFTTVVVDDYPGEEVFRLLDVTHAYACRQRRHGGGQR